MSHHCDNRFKKTVKDVIEDALGSFLFFEVVCVCARARICACVFCFPQLEMTN